MFPVSNQSSFTHIRSHIYNMLNETVHSVTQLNWYNDQLSFATISVSVPGIQAQRTGCFGLRRGQEICIVLVELGLPVTFAIRRNVRIVANALVTWRRSHSRKELGQFFNQKVSKNVWKPHDIHVVNMLYVIVTQRLFFYPNPHTLMYSLPQIELSLTLSKIPYK